MRVERDHLQDSMVLERCMQGIRAWTAKEGQLAAGMRLALLHVKETLKGTVIWRQHFPAMLPPKNLAPTEVQDRRQGPTMPLLLVRMR